MAEQYPNPRVSNDDLTLRRTIAAVRDRRNRMLTLGHKKFDMLTIPVGKAEPGESDRSAVRRELLEEVNVRAKRLKLLKRFYHTFEPLPGQRIRKRVSVFDVPEWEGTPANREPEKHSFMRFLSEKQIRDMSRQTGKHIGVATEAALSSTSNGSGLAAKVASVLRKAAAPAAAAALAAAPTPARGAYPSALNNPGNMRDYGIKWKGAVRPGTRRGGYLKFDSPHSGARAVSRNLVTLGTKRGIPFTVSDVTAAYSAERGKRLADHVKNVSTISGLRSDKVLDPENTGQMVDLLRGVIGAESGQKTLEWFKPIELTNAVLRARQP